MFDLGWSEMLIIAVVAIIVVGPKDLPAMLRSIGRFVGQAKRMANDFTSQFQDALRDSELEDLKKDLEDVTSGNPLADIENSINKDLNEFDDELNKTVSDLDKADEAENAAYEAANENDAGSKDQDEASDGEPGIEPDPGFDVDVDIDTDAVTVTGDEPAALKAAAGDETGAGSR